MIQFHVFVQFYNYMQEGRTLEPKVKDKYVQCKGHTIYAFFIGVIYTRIFMFSVVIKSAVKPYQALPKL